MLRIAPAYWVALTLLAVWPGLALVFTGDWWRYYGLVNVYSPDTVGGGLPASWSLSSEAAFYVLLPFYALAVRRLAGPALGHRWLGVQLGALITVGILCLVARTAALDGQLPAWTILSLLGTADLFALGMAMAVASVWWEHRGTRGRAERALARWPGACWGMAIAALVLAATVFRVPPTAGPNSFARLTGSDHLGFWAHMTANHLLLAAAAGLIVAPVAFGTWGGGLARRVLAHRALAWLGLISYGLFLWHQPLSYELSGWLAEHNGPFLFGNVTLTEFVATLAITAPIAAISYYVVELPFLRRKEPRRKASGRDALASARAVPDRAVTPPPG